MSNLKDELVGAYNKVVRKRDEFLHDHFTNLLKSLERKEKENARPWICKNEVSRKNCRD